MIKQVAHDQAEHERTRVIIVIGYHVFIEMVIEFEVLAYWLGI